MKSKLFFPAALLGLLLGFQTATAADTFTRPAMVAAMATNCLARGLDELAVGATNLAAATQKLLDQPGTNSLAAAQRGWIDLQLAWRRNQMLAHGPVKDPTFWTAIFYPQAFATAVENVVRSPRPLDADFIEVLGSSARGFYVIEHLLFEREPIADGTNAPPPLKLLSATSAAERRRLYVHKLALDLQARLHGAVAESRQPGFAAAFAASGADSVNLLVNQVVDGVETGVLKPLDACLLYVGNPNVRSADLGGASSGTTLSGMKAALAGVRRLYRGADGLGLDDYVRQVNADLAARLEAQFKAADAALNGLKTNPGEAVPNDRAALTLAADEARKLEQLCKVDLVSALGATVLFNANDGD